MSFLNFVQSSDSYRFTVTHRHNHPNIMFMLLLFVVGSVCAWVKESSSLYFLFCLLNICN